MSKQEAPTAVGGSSLLVIFAVLCLTIFALLGLTTVQAESRLAEASAEAVKNYYNADARAEEILALLRQGIVTEGVTGDGEVYCYQCTVSDVQALSVEVRICGEEYQILRWQLVSTSEWEIDDNMNLWNGSME